MCFRLRRAAAAVRSLCACVCMRHTVIVSRVAIAASAVASVASVVSVAPVVPLQHPPTTHRWGSSGSLPCLRVASARGGQSALVLQLNDRSALAAESSAQLWALGEQPLVVVGCLPAAYTDRV